MNLFLLLGICFLSEVIKGVFLHIDEFLLFEFLLLEYERWLAVEGFDILFQSRATAALHFASLVLFDSVRFV